MPVLPITTWLLSVIMLIHFLIPQKTSPPSHSPRHNKFNPANWLLPSLAGTVPISVDRDTTCRESNTWEDSQFVRIGVCAASLDVARRWGGRGETFPALTTYVSTGFIILRVDAHDILSFLVPATKNEAHIGIQGQTTPVGSDWWDRINVCTLFRFPLADRSLGT